eukprot:gene12639-34397_t
MPCAVPTPPVEPAGSILVADLGHLQCARARRAGVRAELLRRCGMPASGGGRRRRAPAAAAGAMAFLHFAPAPLVTVDLASPMLRPASPL